MDDDTYSDYVTFDTSKEFYFTALKVRDNRFRYFKFRFVFHGTNNPVTISSLSFDVKGKTY